MKVLNIGSLNLDYVYSVPHIVGAGETLASRDMNIYLGGKGINQSIALAKAGANVYHCGMIGDDGTVFLDACREYGVNSDYIKQTDTKTGHAIIQIDDNAQNCILIYGGANQQLTKEFIDDVIDKFDKGDILLLQNEINDIAYIVDKAYEKGLTIALNPSPYNEKLDVVDMSKISIFLLNEVEGEQITGKKEPDEIIKSLLEYFPEARIVLTLGGDGAVYADKDTKITQPVFKVDAVDTTAAGDTFTGYFLAGIIEGMPVADILRMSAKASSIAVTRKGAIPSIPYRSEVEY